MNDEQRKQIEALNERYMSEFGRTADGRLRFKWARTDEIFYEFGRDLDTQQDANTGLWLASRAYKRRTAAEMTLSGLCWTLAYLEPPKTREAWLAIYGTDIPWQPNGFYRTIQYREKHIECPPDEDDFIAAAFNIRNELKTLALGHEKAEKAYLERSSAALMKKDRQWKDEISDMVDDAATAFGNNPGGKGSVSLPSVRTIQ